VLVTDAVLSLRKLRDIQSEAIDANTASQAHAITLAWATLALGGVLLTGCRSSCRACSAGRSQRRSRC
jgi:methyl-accepting chemotaxis protein